MKDSNYNIRINYLYRDAGNYKEFGFIIFENPTGISVENITYKIEEKLIDGEFFNPSDWQFPLINSQVFDSELDHDWYEFQSVRLTNEYSTDNRTVDDFLESIFAKAI